MFTIAYITAIEYPSLGYVNNVSNSIQITKAYNAWLKVKGFKNI